MNVLWFIVGGIWICLTHLFYGLLLCITIVGIPWGKMHFRLAKLALSPFGMEVGITHYFRFERTCTAFFHYLFLNCLGIHPHTHSDHHRCHE
jgi:uncharacterized membrane protein YccF (DUF307 family)